tara:strand:+ start:195 stop:3035 length:2841 start_codon:yes stop_codon:yes gene_type:complete
MSEEIGNLNVRISADTDGLERGRKRSEAELDKLRGSMDRAGQVARRLTGLLGAIGVGVGLGSAIREIGSFQESLQGLEAVSSATAAQMAKLEDQARTLGATSMFSAQQAADAQRFLAQAGFEVNEVLGATPGILQLAAAGSLDLGTAADIASNVLGGMRLEVDQLNRVNDVLAATASRSNTTIQQLGQALSFAAPFAAGAGVSIEEAAAAIGNMSDAGIQASRAGTGLVGVIRQLSNVTSGGEDVLSQYGLSISDVSIEARGLAPVLETLRGVNLNTADAIALFGSEAGAAAQVLVNDYSGAIEGASGEAERMALIIGDGLNPAIKSLRSGLSEAVLQMGDSGLAGALEGAIRSAAGVVAVWNGMSNEFAEANDLTKEQQREMENLAGIVSAMAGAVGGLTVALGGLTAAKVAATAATKALTAAMRLNPAIAMASALGAVAGALYSARNAMVVFGDTQARIIDWGRAAWQVTAERISQMWSGAMANVTGALDAAGGRIGSVVSYIWETFRALLNNISDFAKATVNAVIAYFTTLSDATGIIVRTMRDQFANAFENILAIGEGFVESLRAAFTGDFSGSAFKSALNQAMVDPFVGAFEEVRKAAQENFDRDFLGDGVDFAAEAVRGFTTDVSDLAFRFRFAENEAGEAVKGMQESLAQLSDIETPGLPGGSQGQSGESSGGSGAGSEGEDGGRFEGLFPGFMLSEEQLEILRNRLQMRQGILEEFREIDVERESQMYEDRLERLKEALENEAITEQEYYQGAQEAERDHWNKISSTREQALRNLSKMVGDKYGEQAGMASSALAQIVNATATHSERAFKIQKAAAIASAIVSTYQGVAKTLATYPWPIAGVMAAAHLATGLAQVQSIRSQNFSGGTSSGGGGGGSVSTASPSGGGGDVNPPGGQTPSGGTLTVQGISSSALFTGDAVRELAEELIQYQKRGGTVVID